MIKRKQKKKIKINKKLAFSILCGIAVVVLAVVGVIIYLSYAKGSEKESEKELSYSGFSVTFINVGQGNASLIKFDNGESMLIDTGAKDNYQAVKESLKECGISNIKHLVLTHPDNDHIGNAVSILSGYNVDNLYIPQIFDYTKFQSIKEAVDTAKNKNTEIKISDWKTGFTEGDATVQFLTPKGFDSALDTDNVYAELKLEENPSEELINNLSPVIFVEYKGIRFMFPSDARKESERILIEYSESGYYKKVLGKDVDIKDIDFLLVSCHGENIATSNDLLDILKPEYAVFSVGGKVGFGLPSYDVLERLKKSNGNVRLLKTDEHGNIRVFVSSSGKVDVVTDIDLNR